MCAFEKYECVKALLGIYAAKPAVALVIVDKVKHPGTPLAEAVAARVPEFIGVCPKIWLSAAVMLEPDTA